ncbi:hypothetical protein C8R43DRAFT_1193297 [Mycena crocata]|nr:hypothetical protein C8R43DRAFT_1193297 [Mycena crocata]
MSSNSNQEKIDAYTNLDEDQQAEDFLAHSEAAISWMGSADSNPGTCEEALRLFHKIPPVTLGGDSVKTKDMSETERKSPPLRCVKLVPDWLDTVVTSVDFTAAPVAYRQRMKLGPALLEDRRKPAGPDTVERTVDDYHKRFVLDPAAKIAGNMVKSDIKVTYAAQTEGSATDLRVCEGQDMEDGEVNYIVAEDKRGIVWRTHESKLLALLDVKDQGTFTQSMRKHPISAAAATRRNKHSAAEYWLEREQDTDLSGLEGCKTRALRLKTAGRKPLGVKAARRVPFRCKSWRYAEPLGET